MKKKTEVEILTYDGKTIREQRRYIEFLENIIIAGSVLLTITGCGFAAVAATIWF